MQVSEGPTSRRPGGFTGPGGKEDEKVSAWPREETGAGCPPPPALEVILKSGENRSREVRSRSSQAVTWNPAQRLAFPEPRAGTQKGLGALPVCGETEAPAYALKGFLDRNHEVCIRFPSPLNWLERVVCAVWDWVTHPYMCYDGM